VRAHVGKVVDADFETTGEGPKGPSHHLVMPTQRLSPACSLACENDVHRAPRADGPFQFAPPPPRGAAVFGSVELGVDGRSKERPLHESIIAHE
jgi:hypothetical protein